MEVLARLPCPKFTPSRQPTRLDTIYKGGAIPPYLNSHTNLLTSIMDSYTLLDQTTEGASLDPHLLTLTNLRTSRLPPQIAPPQCRRKTLQTNNQTPPHALKPSRRLPHPSPHPTPGHFRRGSRSRCLRSHQTTATRRAASVPRRHNSRLLSLRLQHREDPIPAYVQCARATTLRGGESKDPESEPVRQRQRYGTTAATCCRAGDAGTQEGVGCADGEDYVESTAAAPGRATSEFAEATG
jgi:hypothetical protein